MRLPVSPSLTVEHALLGFVYTQPLHGYELYQQLAVSNGLWEVWRLKQSQLYALLAKLAKEGYLTATLQPQDARPPRKIYALTEKGRSAFLYWLSTPVGHGRQIRLEFRAKLFFAYRQGAPAVMTLLEAQTQACQQWLATLQTQAAPAPNSFAYAVHHFRRSQLEAFLAWLTTCRQALLVANENS